MLPPFDAVILDLDGLVLDTEPTYVFAWRRAAAELGYPLSEKFCLGLSGLPYGVVEERLRAACGETFPLPRFRELAGIRWRRHVAECGIALRPGLAALLDVLDDSGTDYCLATNSRLDNAEECLALAGLGGRFPVIVSSDQVRRPKPAPDLFLEAAKRLLASAARCLAVEDSDVGIEAAWRAGTIPLMVPGAAPPSDDSRRCAHRVLDSLADVARLIAEKHHPRVR